MAYCKCARRRLWKEKRSAPTARRVRPCPPPTQRNDDDDAPPAASSRREHAIVGAFAFTGDHLAGGKGLSLAHKSNSLEHPKQRPKISITDTRAEARGGRVPGPSGEGVASILSMQQLFEQMLLHRNDAACTARGFYTYEAFLAAAATFPAFGSTAEGLSVETRKREVAAFLGQTSHETTGGWPTAPDGPLTWGYCFKQEREPKSIYCDTTKPEWPCAPNKEYIGRGPIQLTWNYNYGLAGRALSLDLLNNPDLVAADAVVSFRTALWFWMTPQANKPSSHAVITGRWTPTAADNAAGRVPGYGVITNIINGGLECGIGPDPRVADRIGFYQRYCGILGVDTGSNLDCYSQRSFNLGVPSTGLAAQ
ncbi:endochitinase-like [Lolium perenne]|uniref:endochitinase-like n=1 Tax=Lolium perenne TaxID=4522 RepID=UPI003A9A031E